MFSRVEKYDPKWTLASRHLLEEHSLVRDSKFTRDNSWTRVVSDNLSTGPSPCSWRVHVFFSFEKMIHIVAYNEFRFIHLAHLYLKICYFCQKSALLSYIQHNVWAAWGPVFHVLSFRLSDRVTYALERAMYLWSVSLEGLWRQWYLVIQQSPLLLLLLGGRVCRGYQLPA